MIHFLTSVNVQHHNNVTSTELMTKSKKPSFEEAIEELEQIVSKMEQGDLPLEEALSSFERGVQLANLSQLKLKQAEQKVKVLVEKNGEHQLIDFDQSQAQNSQEDLL